MPFAITRQVISLIRPLFWPLAARGFSEGCRRGRPVTQEAGATPGCSAEYSAPFDYLHPCLSRRRDVLLPAVEGPGALRRLRTSFSGGAWRSRTPRSRPSGPAPTSQEPGLPPFSGRARGVDTLNQSDLQKGRSLAHTLVFRCLNLLPREFSRLSFWSELPQAGRARQRQCGSSGVLKETIVVLPRRGWRRRQKLGDNVTLLGAEENRW